MNYSDTKGSIASNRVERRLTAILVADVAGYSVLMHADEESTHARVAALLTNTVMVSPRLLPRKKSFVTSLPFARPCFLPPMYEHSKVTTTSERKRME